MTKNDKSPVVRCAVYTRKSSEEGLDQDFNSLDAQRESAQAYIASQRHEGWSCLPERYDDGGFTGGNMERPALNRLYLQHQSLLPVVKELHRRGWVNKRWTTRKGRERGGRPFDKTSLHQLLSNVAYAGKVRYKEEATLILSALDSNWTNHRAES